MDSVRHHADLEDKYNFYFNLLHQKMAQYNVQLEHTYNIDKKGFLISITGRSKRIFSRQMWESREKRALLQDSSREWITLLACVRAAGKALPPGIIYQGAQGNIQLTWVEEIKASKHEVFVTSSPSRWTNNEIGLAWLKQVFNRYTKK
jgi:hypothetical protein